MTAEPRFGGSKIGARAWTCGLDDIVAPKLCFQKLV